MDVLRDVIDEGEAAGLESEELEIAKSIVAANDRKEAAYVALKSAMESQEVDLLKSAIKEAEEAALPEKDFEHVKIALVEEEEEVSDAETVLDFSYLEELQDVELPPKCFALARPPPVTQRQDWPAFRDLSVFDDALKETLAEIDKKKNTETEKCVEQSRKM